MQGQKGKTCMNVYLSCFLRRTSARNNPIAKDTVGKRRKPTIPKTVSEYVTPRSDARSN